MAGVVNRRYTLEVEPTRERLTQVRRITAAHLKYWGLELQVNPVCVAVDELLRNVAAHVEGDKTCVVELRWTGRQLTVSVADRDRRLPRLLTSLKGGLGRVAALSDSWGTCGTSEGKVIWFTRRVKDTQRIPSPGNLPTRTVRVTQPLPATLPLPQDIAARREPVPAGAHASAQSGERPLTAATRAR